MIPASSFFLCGTINLTDLSGFATEGVQRMCGMQSIDLFPLTCHVYVVLCDDDSDESQLPVATFWFLALTPSLCFNCLYLPLTSLLQTHSHTDMHIRWPAGFHRIINYWCVL